MKFKYYILVTISLILSCNTKSPKPRKNHTINGVTVEYFGDTTEIITKKYGDTIITRSYIDLLAKSRSHKFDNSYSETLIYSRRNLDSTIIIEGKSIPIKTIIKENYSSEFSFGDNYYYLNKLGDTVGYKHVLNALK